ncbi:MAG: ankyrin repeat domain-containing protein [Candidatus Latescibacteria bacterium]|nr:ankyrin repeat domain-containing protein [Candidatus Latescibacterota bacterium]
MSPKKQAIDPELVHQFVNDAHGDFDSVKKLLAQEPDLANASWDWGGGDWETGLGAAAHMGRRDIAEHLLQQGARIDLFAAAMLGKLDIVQAIVADDVTVIDRPGPHGISLMVHARKGGKEAAAVVKLLNAAKSKKK